MEDYLAAIVRANRAIQDAARGKADVTCMQALPKDLGDWRPAVEFVLGPFGCGKNLDEISAMDFARSPSATSMRSAARGSARCWRSSAPTCRCSSRRRCTRMQSTRNFVEIETARGRINARAAIVTVSTGVLAADKIKFTPELPKRQLDAIAKLSLGSYDHVALELKGNPLQLQQRRSGVREGDGRAHRRAARQRVGHAARAWSRSRGKFGARAFAGRAKPR